MLLTRILEAEDVTLLTQHHCCRASIRNGGSSESVPPTQTPFTSLSSSDNSYSMGRPDGIRREIMCKTCRFRNGKHVKITAASKLSMTANVIEDILC